MRRSDILVARRDTEVIDTTRFVTSTMPNGPLPSPRPHQPGEEFLLAIRAARRLWERSAAYPPATPAWRSLVRPDPARSYRCGSGGKRELAWGLAAGVVLTKDSRRPAVQQYKSIGDTIV